jgi:aminoglycoside phosphotransferase
VPATGHDRPGLPKEIARAIGDRPLGALVRSATGTTTCTVGGALAEFYLKSGPMDGPNPLSEDIRRLDWLKERRADAPHLVAYGEEEGTGFLLMTALPGEPASAVAARTPERLPLRAIAQALRRFHDLPLPCPFDAGPGGLLDRARRRLERGFVDPASFDPERLGMDPARLLQRLTATLPGETRGAVVHGDATLDNVIIVGDAVSGFVDVGRLGVGDRHNDLAIMERSLRHRVSAAAAEAFLSE